MQRAGGSPVGWVQPTISHSVTSGGLHPPYELRTIASVTLPSPRLNQAGKSGSWAAWKRGRSGWRVFDGRRCPQQEKSSAIDARKSLLFTGPTR